MTKKNKQINKREKANVFENGNATQIAEFQRIQAEKEKKQIVVRRDPRTIILRNPT